MVGFLLPKANFDSADEADALAIAICHASHRQSARALARAVRGVRWWRELLEATAAHASPPPCGEGLGVGGTARAWQLSLIRPSPLALSPQGEGDCAGAAAERRAMIGKLKGIVDAVGEAHAIIDVGGVGYEVQASARTLRALQAGQAVSLAIETHVREDAIRLYGFTSEVERAWFRTLQTIQGVGAKVALAVLGTLSPQDLANAIALQNWAAVEQSPGVGKKLAQRIVAELKDKAPALSVAGLERAGCRPQGRIGSGREQCRRRGDLGAHQPRLPAGAGEPGRGGGHGRAGRGAPIRPS